MGVKVKHYKTYFKDIKVGEEFEMAGGIRWLKRSSRTAHILNHSKVSKKCLLDNWFYFQKDVLVARI